jgi:hypothetical protein
MPADRKPDQSAAADLHPALTYRPPATLKAFYWGGGALLALFAAAIAWVVFWFVVASGARERAEAWAAAERARGAQVRYGRLELGGFPFAVRLTADQPAYAAPPGAARPWAWEGARLTAEMRPWNLSRVRFAAFGPHRLVLPAGDGPLALAGEVARATAEVAFAGGVPWQADAEVAGLDLGGPGRPGLLAAARATLKAQRNPAAGSDPRVSALDFLVGGEALRLPPAMETPLGREVRRFLAEGSLMGAPPAGPLTDSLAAWRDAGGTLEIVRFNLATGPLDVQASGTLALDGDLQPIAALTARIRGFFATVDTLVGRGLVRSRDAAMAKVVLAALAKVPPEGGPPALSVPITIQERRFYAGPVALAELPRLDWTALP